MSSRSEAVASVWPERFGDRVRLLVLTVGGLGLVRFAPGTFGTLGGVVLAVALEPFVTGRTYGVVLLALVLVMMLVGVALGSWAERWFDKKDAGAIVLDEVAGYCVTVAISVLWIGQHPSLIGHVAAFVAFRIFDITKPWPGKEIERVPAGLGVMLDDVVLALYSGPVLALLSLGFPEELLW